jgi:predicted transcriptional regulator
MSTTSLKLPDDLEQKAAAAAHGLGITPHAFMIEAIRQATLAAELRSQFVADAKAAHAEMLQSGQGHDARDVRGYLRDRIVTPDIPRPAAKPWGG